MTIEKSFDETDVIRTKKNIEKTGYTCVTVTPLLSSDQFCHHYTIGLTNLGFPEIILSGQLPSNVAYALIEKLVHKWKARGEAKTGLFTNFVHMSDTSAGKAPICVTAVNTAAAHAAEPQFLDLLEEIIPGASKNMVQLMWPDDRNQLPNNFRYTTEQAYRQVLLPVADIKHI